MKTASRTPDVSALVESIANGENHESSGSIALGPASPAYTLTSATTANSASVTTSAESRKYCVRALSSMPIVVIAVMITIQTTPTAVIAAVDSAAEVQSSSRKLYRPAICARFAMTTMSATMIAQPPIHPSDGPMPRVTHENVVPQSGSARFIQ